MPLTLVEDIGDLAPVGAAGLCGLGVAFFAIIVYGIQATVSGNPNTVNDANPRRRLCSS